MSTPPITVQALAAELGVRWSDIAHRVSALCRQLGPTNVVAQALPSSQQSVIHGSAADLIRDDLATT